MGFTDELMSNDLARVERIPVTRFYPGKIVGGKMKASKMKPFLIIASVQNPNGRDLEIMEEGRRQMFTLKIYTENQLLTSDDQKSQRADLLTLPEGDFEVFHVQHFRGLDLDHYKCFIARRNK